MAERVVTVGDDFTLPSQVQVPPGTVASVRPSGGDDTAAIQAAVDAAEGGGTVLLGAGTFLVAGSIAIKSGVTLRGNGSTIQRTAGASSTSVVQATGTLGTATALTANVAVGAATVAVTSTAGLAVGGYLLLRDATYAYGTSGRNQEIARIADISGTTVTLAERTIGAYTTAATAEAVPLTPVVGASVEDVTINIPSGQDGGGVLTTLSVDVTVRRCEITGFSGRPGISFRESAGCRAEDNDVHDGRNLTSSGLGYGLQAAESSHHCTFADNRVRNVRECMFTNNVRHSAFVDNVIHGVEVNGINTHGSGCRDILFKGNVISGSNGAGIGVGHGADNTPDRNVNISSNIISGCASSGILVNSGSTIASRRSSGVSISDNTVRRFGLTVSAHAGIHVINSDAPTVNGNVIDGDGLGSNPDGIRLNKAEYGATVAENMVRNVLGRGFHLSNVTTEPVLFLGNRIYNATSWQFVVVSSSAPIPAVLVSNFSNGSTTSLLGTEVLIGNRLGAGWVGAPAVSGSRGGNAALASLLTALASAGLVTDSTSA